MNAFKYKQTLSQNLMPLLNDRFPDGSGLFQHDNAPCHKALSVRSWLENESVNVMEWPPYSPDLSPIENLWAILKNKVHKSVFRTSQELMTKLTEIWNHNESLKSSCQVLINSMPQRINACIVAKGGVIKY